MPAQQSANVAQGGTIFADDHNRLVTDVGAIIAEKGAANGLAPLGADSKVPGANLPALADSSVTTAKLADLAVTKGKIAANAVTKANRVQISVAAGSSISTTSSVFVDIAGLTMNVTTDGGDLLVFMNGGPFYITSDSLSAVIVAISVNGTDYSTGQWRLNEPSAFTGMVALTSDWSWSVLVTGLPAGTYTIKGRHRSDGTNTAYTIYPQPSTTPGYAQITCLELKR